MTECPVCKQKVTGPVQMSFSKEGTWCNHAGWVLRTGASRDDPPILGSFDIEAPSEFGRQFQDGST